jgi:hypothetical protein
MGREETRELGARFAAGPRLLREAVRDLEGGGVTARVAGDDWSIRDILHHLADAELVRAVRIRTIIAEPGSAIAQWDEGAWQRRLQYLWRSPELALAAFDTVRTGTAELLMHCDAGAWERAGVTADGGELTVQELVERGVTHVDEHCGQIGAIRAAMKPRQPGG